MKKISRTFPIVLYFLVSIVVISCDGSGGDGNLPLVSNTDFEASEPFNIEVPVSSHMLLNLTGINGDVSSTGVTGANSVVIAGVKRVLSESTEDAETHLQELIVDVQDLINEVRVQTVQPGDTGGRIYIVDYTISLPSHLVNQIINTNGSVTLDSIDNDVTVLNLNGSVTLRDVFGSASANLLNGKIEGEVTLPLNGTIDMKTLNGDIELNIPVNTSAQFSASVSIGTITVSNLVLQNEVSTPTFLSGTLGSGQGTINLESEQLGNISVSGS